MNNTKEKQKGIISIFITMMIMSTSLAMVLGLSIIFIGHLKIVRGMGDSVVAFHAANTGMERILYEYKIQGGLATSTSFSNILNNGAIYNAKFYGAGHFKSVGTFKGTRRAIEVSFR